MQASLRLAAGGSAGHHAVDRPVFAAAPLALGVVAAEPPARLGTHEGLEAGGAAACGRAMVAPQSKLRLGRRLLVDGATVIPELWDETPQKRPRPADVAGRRTSSIAGAGFEPATFGL
jgi:hypothetical protein